MRVVITLGRLLAMAPDDAAAEWLIQRRDGPTDAETEAFEQWLTRREEHRRAWERVQRDWAVFADAEASDLFSAMREHALSAAPQPARLSRTWAAAAALIVSAGTALTFSVLPHLWGASHDQTSKGEPPAPAGIVYRTAPGEVRSVVLADGSIATLNKASELVGRVDGRRRAYELLRGQVYVEVKRDVRVFTMLAGNHLIRDVGTHFDTDLSSGKLRVVTLEGAVSVARPGGPAIMVEAGKQLIAASGADGVVGPANSAAGMWHSGMLHFDDEPLSAVIHTLNQYSIEQLVVRDPGVAALRITGSFQAGQTDRFTKTIAVLYPIRANALRPHVIELSSAPGG